MKLTFSVILTEKQAEYLDNVCQLSGKTKADVLRVALMNLWELTWAMQYAQGGISGRDLRYEFENIDENFNAKYTSGGGKL